MTKKAITLPRDRLTEHYREIGPAALIAALLSAPRRPNARNDNRRQSILAA
ncbi:hydrolase [Phyllobacterium leguminum]|uniref:Uncharacterized protein n=1 Tax=Phyllobacterium leguminum TaxID=314237 RepID=A0A318T3D2_9HYPH|nr:hydrolase [Phyllobacterium leguminum]PYE88492.1 hypothetical protein C7477_107135 [Phyllobacterium leguminum]